MKNTYSQHGFAVMYSVLIGSVLLLIGLSVLDIMVRERRLSSTGRESQFAFYAADTGVECALYWNLQHDSSNGSAFATSTTDAQYRETQDGNNRIQCLGGDHTVTILQGDSSGAVSQFQFSFPDTPYEGRVRVEKRANPDGDGIDTTIESRGYNAPSGPRRLERGIRATIRPGEDE